MLKTDLNGRVVPPKRKKKRSTPQNDLFNMPDQKKYTGPKNVPATSRAAYNEPGTKKRISNGAFVAENLLRKFPGKTAYELLALSETFTDIYVLRRYLSGLKRDGDAHNPSERICTVAARKTYTWRLVNE